MTSTISIYKGHGNPRLPRQSHRSRVHRTQQWIKRGIYLSPPVPVPARMRQLSCVMDDPGRYAGKGVLQAVSNVE